MNGITLTASPYVPSSPLTGSEAMVAYRAKNLKLRGTPPNLYYECYAGSENLNEPIPVTSITGTISFSPSSRIVTGAGTAFFTDLHPKQMIFAGAEAIQIAEILTDTTFVAGRDFVTTSVGVTATHTPILGALDIDRFSMEWGNAIHWDKGTITAVGQGELYVNGAVLAGDSLTATRSAQIALYDAATQTYDVQPIGFSTIPTITNSNITVVGSGGTKNQSLGYYSFRVAYYSSVTGGYSNSTNTLLASGTAGYQLTAANSTFNFDFSGDTPPDKADSYIIYGSAYGGSSANSAINAIQGAWFQIGDPIPFTSLVAGHYIFDYTDADLDALRPASFDNNAPPEAEFIANLVGYVALVSTDGQGVGNGSRQTTTSPGAYVSPMKADNFDGYPATGKVPTEKGENIIGQVSAAGRLFVLTSNTLQAVTPTGLPSAPFSCRPFWKRGFQGTYNLTFADDTLYGFTTAGMFRSIATGDEAGASNDFAADVQTETVNWNGGYVFAEQDLKNEEVCFFYSASRQNEDGYWESDIYPYSLALRCWQPPVILSDSTRDMIVTGVASVNGHLEFIAGGRRDGDTDQWDTWRYDTGSEIVPWYIAWNYIDAGTEMISKVLRKLRPKGKFTDATMQIYATTPDTNVDVTDLTTGANATYEVVLDDSTTVKQYEISKCRVRNALMWTARMEGTWDGTGTKDQLHELAVTFDIAGQER